MDSFLIEIPIPSMGATVNEMTLVDLMVHAGDTIAKGQKIAEFESDKSVFDYEAPCDGTVKAVLCRAGDVLEIGIPFLRVETGDDSLRHLVADGKAFANAPAKTGERFAAKKKAPAVRPKPEQSPPAAAGPGTAVAEPPTRGAPAGRKWTPRAVKIARDAGFDPAVLEDVPATGPGNRVSGDDIQKYLEARDGDGEAAPQVAAEIARGEETVCVAGMGYAVPRNVRSNKDILKAFPDMTEE